MKDEKKPLPDLAHQGTASGENVCDYDTPRFDNNTIPERVQGPFEAILQKGAENGKTVEELRRILGVSESRIIRAMIAKERAAGSVILSGQTGYYLPDDGEKGRQEVAAFVAQIMAKGSNTIRAADSAKAFLAKLPGQEELEVCQKGL